jgi:hypothetical protein
MFRLRELTTHAAETAAAQAAVMAFVRHFVLNYLFIIKGWSGLGLSLTCRQGEFAQNLSEEGMRTKTSGTN